MYNELEAQKIKIKLIEFIVQYSGKEQEFLKFLNSKSTKANNFAFDKRAVHPDFFCAAHANDFFLYLVIKGPSPQHHKDEWNINSSSTPSGSFENVSNIM